MNTETILRLMLVAQGLLIITSFFITHGIVQRHRIANRKLIASLKAFIDINTIIATSRTGFCICGSRSSDHEPGTTDRSKIAHASEPESEYALTQIRKRVEQALNEVKEADLS